MDVLYCSYGLEALNQGFSEAPDIPLYKKHRGKVGPPPKIFVPLNMYVRDTLLIYVDETVHSLFPGNVMDCDV